MSLETGTIVEIIGTEAEVLLTGTEACKSCAARQACNTLGGNTKKLLLKNTLKASPGDAIEFIVEEKGVVVSSIIVYLIPLLFLISGIWIGSVVHADFSIDQDSGAILGGIVGICLSFILIKAFNPYFRRKSIFVPQMHRILNKENNGKNINNEPSCADN